MWRILSLIPNCFFTLKDDTPLFSVTPSTTFGYISLANLRTLNLYNNQISNISALAGMANLREVRLNNNQINDISALSGKPYLAVLKLQYNQITDMSPVVNLTALTNLDLGVNPITTVPDVSSLRNLTAFSLYSCAVNSVSDLSGLVSLDYLNLYNNQITDISAVSGLSRVKTLHLGWNQISDVSPLAGLTSLELLDIRRNQFTSILPLAGLTNLRSLWLTEGQLTDISVLANCSLLNELRLENNQITDVSSLAGLANLTSLLLSGNQIADASSLSGLTNLTSLTLSWNQITDFSWLSNLPGLTLLSVEGNPISDLSFLQNLTALQTLWAGNDQVVDITPLAALTQLRQLYLESAQISDISALTSLTNLSELRLSDNPLSEEAYSTDIPIIQANNPGLTLTVDPNPYNYSAEGHILFEYFWGTDSMLGSLLALPTFPDDPNQSELRTSFEGLTNWRYNYGTRVRGYLSPPQTGDYTFWIASDDQSQLWLSTDENPANAVQIASVPGWTPPRDFDNTGGGAGGPEQESSPVPLEAGRRYYIEALCAQGGGGANLAVAWQGPSIPTRQVISGTFLSAWIEDTEDSDGVPGSVEDAAPNGGDGNADGTPDSQQDNVASLPNAVDGQYVTLVSPEGTEVQNTIAAGNPSPADAPPGVEFPVGFFDFALSGMGVGGSTTMTIILPPGQTVETYYKYGPTPDNSSPHWYEFLYDGTTGAEILSDRVILHLVDGLRGDDDLSADGLITEPGAPSVRLNRPPVATITGPSSGLVVPVGSPVALTGGIYDPDAGDAHTAQWTLSAEQVTGPLVINGTVAGNTVADTIVLTQPGIYSIVLTVTDGAGASGTANMVGEDMPAYVVVYDPEGGFATGGGWIWSPPGAYRANPELEGKASFGFISKYQKGATIPTGQTEFVFRAGDLNFHSTSYEWLVVDQNGSNAQYKGSGTINGAGVYKFMLWAGDGAPDTFRMKIWLEEGGVEATVYDNGVAQAVGGGSIVVHKE